MRKKYYLTLAVCCGAAGMLLSGCKEGNTYAPPPPPAVTVQPPSQRDVVVYAKFPGQIQAVEEVEITARVKGYLRSVDYKDGAMVKKDQQLFQIEPDQYIASRDGAQAHLSKAKAQLQLAEASLKRMKQAYETKAVSEIDVLSAEAEMEAGVADVMNAEAQLKAAELDLSYTSVKSPISGRTSRHLVSVGNLVGGAGPSLLTTVVSIDPVQVYFNIDERFIITLMKLKTDEGEDEYDKVIGNIRMELADSSVYEETGVIDFIDNRLDPATGTMRVRAVFDNPNRILSPGQFGRILIPRSLSQAILVSNQAVQRDLEGDFVLVVGKDNKVERREVTPGPLVGTERIIREGIDPGDRVIIEGLQRARAGIEVQPDREDASADATAINKPEQSDQQ